MKKYLLVIVNIFVVVGIIQIVSCKKDNDPEEEEDPVEIVYKNADGLLGGMFYDKFWVTSEYKKPEDLKLNDIDEYPNFYRCQHCHGWDLRGKEGVYINKKAKFNRPNVAGSIYEFIKAKDKLKLFDAIKNKGGRKVDPKLTEDGRTGDGDEHPDYGLIFEDDQIWDIVKFLKEEIINTKDLYDLETSGDYPTGTAELKDIGLDGDEKRGKELYAKSCDDGKSCHGSDGAKFDVNGLNIGDFFRMKPYEVQHKVKFGNPGKSMPNFPDFTLEDMKDLLKAGQDEEAFPSL